MKRGFTLIEMLVALAILTIMIMAVLANTRDLGTEARVKVSVGDIVDTAKQTRNDSVSVAAFGSTTFPSYGIDFDTSEPDQMLIYADCVADDNDDGIVNNLDTFNYSSDLNNCGASGNLVKTVSLEPGTEISAIRATYPDDVGATSTHSESKADILFLRPEPTLWITVPSAENITDNPDGLISTGEIEVDVSDTNHDYTKTITLYSSGEFSAEN